MSEEFLAQMMKFMKMFGKMQDFDQPAEPQEELGNKRNGVILDEKYFRRIERFDGDFLKYRA